jgi:hypothetical protein
LKEGALVKPRGAFASALVLLSFLSACARDQAVTQKAALTLKERVESTDRPDFVRAGGASGTDLEGRAPLLSESRLRSRVLARYREIAERDVSAEDRVAQIELNLERWRWLPEELGHDKKHRALLGLDRPKSTPAAQAR